jgi:hypothetical protein
MKLKRAGPGPGPLQVDVLKIRIAGRGLLARVFGNVENKDALRRTWTLQHFRMRKRLYRVVVTRAPMVHHAQARELIVLRIAFVASGVIDEVDEVPDLAFAISGSFAKTSYYDTSALKDTLERLIDFRNRPLRCADRLLPYRPYLPSLVPCHPRPCQRFL